MNAEKFFSSEIKDNSYEGFPLGQITDYREDFFCNTYRKKREYKNTLRKEAVFNFVKEIHQKIAHKNVSDLNNLTQIIFDEEYDANINQTIFNLSGYDLTNLKIHTNNIVGSIVYKNISFNINCRFGNQFLQYMIANTSGFLELENMGSINNSIGLGEWILIYYWKLRLKKAFSLGIYKTYEKNNENRTTIRGSININSILRKPYFDGKIECNFREHSFNNPLNSIINQTLNKVFKSKFQPIISDIYNIKNAYNSLNTENLNINHIDNQKVINPYYKKYNEVYNLSLKILRNKFANIGDDNSKLSAFIFDISLLFEHHIRKVLKAKYTLFPKNKVEFSIPNGIGQNNLYPDIIIDYGNNNIGVYDVKYKNFDFRYGVNREDRFQLTTYVSTHLNEYNVIHCGIIYPLEKSKFDKLQKIKNQKLVINNKEIPFQVKFYRVYDNINTQMIFDREFKL